MHLFDAFVLVYTSPVGGEVTVAVVFACMWPFFVEVRKALGASDEDDFRPLPL